MSSILPDQKELIKSEIERGTGVGIGMEPIVSGRQSGLHMWFSDLEKSRSPLIELRPRGLHRHSIRLGFGRFSNETKSVMAQADEESVRLARALVRSVGLATSVKIVPDHRSFEDWSVSDQSFSISAEKIYGKDRFSEAAIIATCREIVIPLLGAMAELYGYETVIDDETVQNEEIMEGAISRMTVTRRERNPRNRLLCLRIHGSVCSVCNIDPGKIYGEIGELIEVHHLQPLSLQSEARPYNPEIDLIPLCPNCHRAVHTKRPVPWEPAEIKRLMNEVRIG